MGASALMKSTAVGKLANSMDLVSRSWSPVQPAFSEVRREAMSSSSSSAAIPGTVSPADTLPHVTGRLVWVDCEMTGLDLRRDALIEVAVVVTEADLTPLG